MPKTILPYTPHVHALFKKAPSILPHGFAEQNADVRTIISAHAAIFSRAPVYRNCPSITPARTHTNPRNTLPMIYSVAFQNEPSINSALDSNMYVENVV